MAEGGTWDREELTDFQSSAASNYGRPPPRPLDSQQSSGSSAPQGGTISPPPRISSDSAAASSISNWRDTSTAISESHETSAPITQDAPGPVDTGFDENVLRRLCDMDVCRLSRLLRQRGLMIDCSAVSLCFSIA